MQQQQMMIEKTSRDLSTTWPRMTQEARVRVRQHLQDGCWCDHKTATLKRRLVSGHVIVHLQCDGCGRGMSGGLARADHFSWQSYPDWDQSLADRFNASQQAKLLDGHQQQIVEMQAAKRKLSDEYMAWCRVSPGWAQLSHQVMRRAAFVCEACLTNRACVAHHVTYTYGRLPPAWALRAVCQACHDRLHADKHGREDEWAA